MLPEAGIFRHAKCESHTNLWRGYRILSIFRTTPFLCPPYPFRYIPVEGTSQDGSQGREVTYTERFKVHRARGAKRGCRLLCRGGWAVTLSKKLPPQQCHLVETSTLAFGATNTRKHTSCALCRLSMIWVWTYSLTVCPIHHTSPSIPFPGGLYSDRQSPVAWSCWFKLPWLW